MRKYFAFLLCVVILGAGCSVSQPSSNTRTLVPQNSPDGSISTELDLSDRGLAAIPMDIFSRTELVKLDLSNNQLVNAPQSQIGQLKNLKSLDLSNNALTGLPAEIGQLSKLEVLNVSNNKLTGLPMELGNLAQLRILDISGNSYSTRDVDGIAAKLSKTEIIR